MTVFCTESYENTNNVLKQEKKNGLKELLPSLKKAKSSTISLYYKDNVEPCYGKDVSQVTVIFGTRAEGNCPGYENCRSWDPGVRNPQDVQDRRMKSYSRIYPKGHGGRKLLGNFLQGTKSFRPQDRNFQDMYGYAYIKIYIQQNI